MNPSIDDLGERLRRLREARALSQRDLAVAASVAPTTIWRIEQEHARARPSTIRKLARALAVKPIALTAGADE